MTDYKGRYRCLCMPARDGRDDAATEPYRHIYERIHTSFRAGRLVCKTAIDPESLEKCGYINSDCGSEAAMTDYKGIYICLTYACSGRAG